jgi:hypothetical protein
MNRESSEEDTGGPQKHHKTVVLKDFEFDHARAPHPTILLVGKRFAGKSAMQVAIAESFPVPRWSAWCGTKETEDFWADRFESSASVWGPDERGKDALRRIIAYQENKVRLYKKVLKLPFPAKYGIGLVFDDVTSKREFRKGEILEDLFSNGRHYKAVILISCQYLKQLPPAVRTNTDYLVMMHNSKRTCKLLHDEYVENPDDFNVFLGLLRRVTGQKDEHKRELFNGLVYDNNAKTFKLNKMFYVFRHYEGFDPNNVTIGHPDWHEFNRTHYHDTERESHLKEYRKKKRVARLLQYQGDREDEDTTVENLDLDILSDSADDGLDTCHVDKRKGTHGGLVLKMTKGKTPANLRRFVWPDNMNIAETERHGKYATEDSASDSEAMQYQESDSRPNRTRTRGATHPYSPVSRSVSRTGDVFRRQGVSRRHLARNSPNNQTLASSTQALRASSFQFENKASDILASRVKKWKFG